MLSTNLLLFTVLSYDVTVDNEGIIAWWWFTTATWWWWVEALWGHPVMDIQDTEWINVKIKFSDGEKNNKTTYYYYSSSMTGLCTRIMSV